MPIRYACGRDERSDNEHLLAIALKTGAELINNTLTGLFPYYVVR